MTGIYEAHLAEDVIPELRAEIERWKLTVALREAEIERLRAQKATLICDGCRRLGDVEADNEWLRTLLGEALNDQDYQPQWAIDARRALEPKP